MRSVEELLRSNVRVRGVLVAPQLLEAPRGQILRDSLTSSSVEVLEVSEKDFRSAAATESPQGVLAVAEIPPFKLSTLNLPPKCRVLILDGVQDPGNVGTILRTAAALGAVATVAMPGTVDIWNPKVIRSSMGAQFSHPSLHASLAELFEFLDRNGVELWAAEAGGQSLNRGEAPDRLAIAVGNEGAGVSSDVRGRASRTVSLPIASTVESLNVAVAAGIILHELRA
ncbi:MAG TPA: RNA methyltransferase [Gemmatimonadaceae bacterium]|nr:RNA methyltransferase [Gemmatimonadaceae bacterium]